MKKLLFFSLLVGTAYAAEIKEFNAEIEKAGETIDKVIDVIIDGAVVVNVAMDMKPGFNKLFEEGIPLPGAYQKSDGQVFNPFTDICWQCAFPIHIAGIGEEGQKATCSCLTKGILLGFPLSFWEPSAIIEVTRTPYKFLSLNAVFGNAKSLKDHGSATLGDASSSFYQVHYIPFPIFRVLAFVPGFTCMKEWKDLNPPWCTEWDPSWKYPEFARCFASKKFTHSSEDIEKCYKECEALTQGTQPPDGDYWWCAGCLGSYYPLSGHVTPHRSGPEDSALLVHRILGKFHTIRSWFGLPNGYADEHDYCGDQIKKDGYFPKQFFKKQVIYPRPIGKERGKGCCHFLGAPVEQWGNNLAFPDGGEDFSYLVWTKRQCCFNVGALPRLSGAIESAKSLLDGIQAKITSKIEKLPVYFQNLINPAQALKFIEKTKDICDRAQNIVDTATAEKAFNEMVPDFEKTLAEEAKG